MGRGALIAALLVMATSVQAQVTRPTTAPTTGPTTAPAPDPSTPRGALLLFNRALRDGDTTTIKQSFITANPLESKMVDTVAEVAAAFAQMHAAAAKTFGEGHAGKFGETDSADIDQIESAEITLNGDTATVRYKDSKHRPFDLKKSGGRWKLPAAQLGKPADAAALDQQLADLAVQAKLMRQIAEEIKAGKFTDADQAADAWHSRMLQAATSQPSTSSSTGSAESRG